jgi:hypothetical protein
MVTFVRIAPRLHVPERWQANPAHARMYFVGPNALADKIDPAKEITRGTLVIAPRLSLNAWKHALSNLTAEVEQLLLKEPYQLAFLAPGGGLRKGDAIPVKAGGTVVTSKSIAVGSPEFSPAAGFLWELMIPDGTIFSADATRLVLTLPPNRAKLLLSKRDTVLIPELDGRCEIEIDWDGPARGALRFRAKVTASQLEALGAGPRYFAAPGGKNDEGKLAIESYAYPLLALADTPEVFGFQIDCASPYEDEPDDAAESPSTRPRSILTPPDHGLRSHLHQVRVGEVLLTPAQAAGHPKGCFALTASPEVLKTTASGLALQRGGHYFTPLGAFAVETENAEQESVRLTLGLSHLENVTVRKTDLLAFERSQPAFENRHALKEVAAGAEETVTALIPLNGLCTTSWMRLVPGAGVEADAEPFSLQPEGMQAYVPLAESAQVLEFHAVRYPNTGQPFPIAPLLGVRTGEDGSGKIDARRRLMFEQSVIALARRREIANDRTVTRPAGAEASATTTARTPQGYLASRTGSARAWNNIVFTRTSLRETDGGFPELTEVGISAPEGTPAASHLAHVLAQNRLMLVTTWKTLERLQFNLDAFKRLHIGGWGVHIGGELPLSDPGAPRDEFDPLVVIKYADRSIADLAQDESQWILRDTFSDGTTRDRFQKEICKAIGGTVCKTIHKTEIDPLREPLKQRLQDPNWNGLLLLDALLPLTGIPEQMRAIAGGLPPYIDVPYAGLDVTGIDPDQSDDKPWKSALFGLMQHDKQDIAFSTDKNSGIGMRVTKLVVRVENDGIERFDCTLELRLPGLFDVTAANPEADLKLDGRYESTVIDGRRRETYTFEAAQEVTKTFSASNVVKSATFRRMCLVTHSAQDKQTQGSFIIDGSIAFNKVLDADLFGIEALDFTDLGIDLAFLVGNLGKLELSLNYQKLKFDLDLFNSGNGRRKLPGFMNAFPLKLRGFRFGDFKLPELGFFDLGSLAPADAFQLSDAFKFGHDFDLDLGSLGALAEKLDRFKLQILLGWKPNFDDSKAWTDIAAGFRIDFGKGGGGFDLGVQGILRLWAEKFNLKRIGDIFMLSADDCHIDILGKTLPEQGQEFSLYLFANPKGGAPFERLGWFANFQDDHPEFPLAVNSLALGQRVDVRFSDQGGGVDTVNSTSKALQWLKDVQNFKNERQFVDFAGKHIDYDRNREWFLALKGDFYKVLRLGLVLKDPDMYGVYLGFLAQDNAPEAAPFSFDLLYQKLANGVGRYSVEVGLPPGYRSFECGAASITLGMLRMEVYTDGGFLFDLGFPEHVDYTRSFALQAAIFIGKGGLYFGSVPSVTVPNMPGEPDAYLPVFRAGFALKAGLGREFEQGPLRAGLSICVFGRMEGYFAIADKDKPGIDRKFLAPYPYWMRLHGELGLIAEIEGYVDLRLIRARVLVRVWIATGIVLETALPIVLYCEAGISIAIEFEIASFKVFGQRISITVMLRYSTTLHYEFQLPAKVPVFELPGSPKVEALAPPTEAGPQLGGWPSPTATGLGVEARPIKLHLGYDFTVAGRDGAPGEAPARTVLVPTVLWLTGDDYNKETRPFEPIVRALIAWAALRARPEEANASDIELRKDSGDELDLELLEESIRGLDDLPFDTLEAFFSEIVPGSQLHHIPAGTEKATGFLFPVPPRLAIKKTWSSGGSVHDFAQLGRVTEGEADAVFSDLQHQFAEVSERARGSARVESAERQPLVDHIFRSWCTALALCACDAARTAWRTETATTLTVRAFLDALSAAHWNEIASRAGRLLLSGTRTSSLGPDRPLVEAAGLFIDFPADATGANLAPAKGTGPAWLDVAEDEMTVDWADLNAVATAPVAMEKRREIAPAFRRVPRRFYQPPALAVHQGATPASLCRLSSDLLASGAGRRYDELRFSTVKTSDKSGQLPLEGAELGRSSAALVFEMTLAPLPVGEAAVDDGRLPTPAAFRIAGASEADRLGLDALVEYMENTDPPPTLAGTRLLVGWREGVEPQASLELLPIADHLSDCVVARSTVSIERRPFDAAKLATAEAQKRESPEERFLATFEPVSRYQLLYMLRRAAIVNAEGTYLLLPETLAALVHEKFEAAGANRRTVKLMLAVIFEPGTEPPKGVCNAVLFEETADLQLLAQPERRMVAQLAALSDETNADDPMVEVVSTRPAGTDLVRVWRKRAATDGTGVPSASGFGAHLAQRFDMLEFQLRRAGETAQLLPFQKSLPLGSEEAVPPLKKEGAQSEGYPQALHEQLTAELPQGYEATDLRYDLIVPISTLAYPGQNRYAAMGQKFELDIGWRDVWGNRLGAESQDTISLTPTYTDAVVPLASWPCLKARVYPGDAGTCELVLALAVDARTVPSSAKDRLAAANELSRVMDQVSDPGATPLLRCGLGAIAAQPDATKLHAFLGRIEDALRQNRLPDDETWSHPTRVGIDPGKDFLPISLDFSVVRLDMLVDKHDHSKVPGITSAWSPVRMDSNAGTPDFQRAFATEFQDAFSFDSGGQPQRFWAALGTSDNGQQEWWAMNDRMIPASTATPPQAYAVPPMARALMSAKNVTPWIRQDADALLADFFDRIETFLSPTHARNTALARTPLEADPPPFERVARAKARLLGDEDHPSPLLDKLQPVFVPTATDDADPDRKKAAIAELREACAPDLRRFYEVACVMVKDLVPRIDRAWVPAKDQRRPKLYGQLKVVLASASPAPFRIMTRGIPVDPERMQIALPILPDLKADEVEANLGQIDYEVTHVEREVMSPTPGVLGGSRWLTLVPTLPRASGPRLPTIPIARDDKAPLPRRRVPAPPTWGDTHAQAYSRDTEVKEYAEKILAARRWEYRFDIEAEFKPSDEICGRLLYNLPAGNASAAGEAPESAAQPLFPELFDRLAEHSLEAAEYWRTIVDENKRRRAPGESVSDAFTEACNLFAKSVKRVMEAFTPALTESATTRQDQDRFILTDTFLKEESAHRTTIRFADHFQDNAPQPVLAGNGLPWLRIQRVLEGKRPPDETKGIGVDGHDLDRDNVHAEFMFEGKAEKSEVGACREVTVGRLDVLRQQSVWVAASVRRNRLIGGHALNESFVYRTPESFLHAATSPQIVHKQAIYLAPDSPSTLEELMADGLRPIIQEVDPERGAYVQVGVNYESGRLTGLVEDAFDAIGSPDGLGLQPDPILLIAATKVNNGEDAAMQLARVAAARLRSQFAAEPVGRASDHSRGRIVLNVTVSAEASKASAAAAPGQTILQLERLVLDLGQVTDLTKGPT